MKLTKLAFSSIHHVQIMQGDQITCRTDFNDPDGVECDAFAHATAAASSFDDLHYRVSVATENNFK
jgi:hypothetical protein